MFRVRLLLTLRVRLRDRLGSGFKFRVWNRVGFRFGGKARVRVMIRVRVGFRVGSALN